MIHRPRNRRRVATSRPNPTYRRLRRHFASRRLRKSDNQVDTLVKHLQQKGVEPQDLDDMVHDAASNIASHVNNAGIYDQVEFLVENGYFSDLVRWLDEL